MTKANLARVTGIVLLSGAIALGVGKGYEIQSVAFDRVSKKLTIGYQTTDGDISISVVDNGPIVLCLINRLLRGKYKQPWTGQTLDAADSRLLSQALATIPGEKAKTLRGVLANHSRKAAELEDVFKELESTIRNGLEDHTTQFQEERMAIPPVKADLADRAKALTRKIEAFKGTTDPEELELMQRYERQLETIRAEIASRKPEKKVQKGRENPVNWGFCVKDEASKSRTFITNSRESIERLLKETATAVRNLLSSRRKSSEHDDH